MYILSHNIVFNFTSALDKEQRAPSTRFREPKRTHIYTYTQNPQSYLMRLAYSILNDN